MSADCERCMCVSCVQADVEASAAGGWRRRVRPLRQGRRPLPTVTATEIPSARRAAASAMGVGNGGSAAASRRRCWRYRWRARAGRVRCAVCGVRRAASGEEEPCGPGWCPGRTGDQLCNGCHAVWVQAGLGGRRPAAGGRAVPGQPARAVLIVRRLGDDEQLTPRAGDEHAVPQLLRSVRGERPAGDVGGHLGGGAAVRELRCGGAWRRWVDGGARRRYAVRQLLQGVAACGQPCGRAVPSGAGGVVLGVRRQDGVPVEPWPAG